jgi:mannosyltransferase OCH1-like enzyme
MNNLLLLLVILLILILYQKTCEAFTDNKIVPKNVLDQVDKVNNGKPIPKIIHHICPTDFRKWNPIWYICYETWLRLYPKPEYTHMHWDDKELDEFIAKEFPWFLDTYRGYDVNIKRYDISRLFLLYHYGGIYADMDYICYKNFYDELPKGIVCIPESPYKWNEHIQNSLMMSPPKQPFWLVLIEEAFKRTSWNVFSATGPQLLTPMYMKHKDMVHVLPFELYNPDVYQDNKDIKNTKNVYAKHLLTTVWNKDDDGNFIEKGK